MCDGYAADGYLAVAPALFDRIEPGVDIGYTPDDIARGRDLRGRAKNDDALADIAAARTVAAEAGKVGVVGYCWGGYLAWLAAARVPGLACAICYYGGGMHEAIGEKPRVPVLAHFGEKDSMIPVAGVDASWPKRIRRPRCTSTRPTTASTATSADRIDAASAKLARERSIAFLREYRGPRPRPAP